MINATTLARGVVHWLGFESACAREHLLSEGSLTVPVGQVLYSSPERNIETEHPYPAIPSRRIDFVVRNRQPPHTLHDAIEAKLIRATGRSYVQEVFDDLLRLETLTDYAVGRWMLIAGVWSDLQEKLFNAEINAGDGTPRVKAFEGVLPTTILGAAGANRLTVNLEQSGVAVRKRWFNAQQEHKLPAVPNKMLIDLRAQYPKKPTPRQYTCFIWRILRCKDRAGITLEEAKTQ